MEQTMIKSAKVELDVRHALVLGVAGGSSAVLVSAMGIITSFSERMVINPFLTSGYLLLFLIYYGIGYLAGRPPPVLEGVEAPKKGAPNVISGLIAGVVTGAMLGLFVIVATLFDLRDVFVNISPELIEILTLGQSTGVGMLLLTLVGAVLGAAGGVTHLLSDRWRRPMIMAFVWVFTAGVLQDLFIGVLRGLNLNFLVRFFFKGTGGLTIAGAVIIWLFAFVLYYYLGRRPVNVQSRYAQLPTDRRRRVRYGVIAVVAVILLLLPQILGLYLSEILNLVGISLLMGLGLNIVVGFAGMLDLGYVAFFAVGAYVTAVLTSPASNAIKPELTFWLAIPFVVLAAAAAGVLVGTPVLRMRGDYLAIVTLGFGEIARILALSDWMKVYVGGAQGILRVPPVPFGPLGLHTPQELYYPILFFCLIAAYISWRLLDSRTGRAWIAMREDESVAEAMGINIVTTKLLAFVFGAMIASFSGALFATKIGSVFPHSFDIQVSIQILVLLIVGGMGSIPGVVVGALVIVGLPQLLTEFDEYREFFYGVLLIVVMRWRPEGLLPSARRARELHEEDLQQDAWVQAARTHVEAPASASD
jgi:branched-chain amino acid transport system permease protein